jgi:hypothetical protein
MTLLDILLSIWTWTAQHPLAAFFVMLVEFAVLFEIYHRADGTLLETLIRVVGLVVFVPQDWIMNWMLSIIFFDLPAQPFELVTARMRRYKSIYHLRNQAMLSKMARWRYGFAVWLCHHLNRSDPGHC